MSLRAVLSGAALVGAGVTLCGCGSGKTTAAPTPSPTPSPSEVATAWANHFSAFAAGAASLDPSGERTSALNQIMLDYDEESTIATFNDACPGGKDQDPIATRNGYTEHTGTTAIRAFFDDLFTQLNDDAETAELNFVGPIDGAPVVLEGSNPEGNVFLTWRTSGLTGARDIQRATDSFSWRIKDGKAIIWKQNIVTTEPAKTCSQAPAVTDPCTPENALCKGWDNHFAAFSAGAGSADGSTDRTDALNKIMEDYVEDSIVQVYDNRLANNNDNNAYQKFEGRDAIRGMFDGLFTAIMAENPTAVKVLLLEKEPDFDGVFLVWESASHPKATDTFVFDNDGKIIRQNIVVTTKTPPPELKIQV